MKFVWVPSIKRFRRTETEVKKERLAYEVMEFEIDKDSLIDRFNAYEETIEALERQIASGCAQPAAVETPELEPDPAPELDAPPPTQNRNLPDEADIKRKLALSLRGMEADAIEEKILDSKGAPFGRFLCASLERLGSLGDAGWEQVRAFLDRDYKKAGPLDRGLRFLALAQIAAMSGEKQSADDVHG